MQFRNETSYNKHDSALVVGNERITVRNGVKKRCEMAIYALMRLGPSKLGNIYAEFLKKSDTYSLNDVQYALGRLVKEGLVSLRDNHTYRVRADVIKRWRAMPKDMI